MDKLDDYPTGWHKPQPNPVPFIEGEERQRREESWIVNTQIRYQT